MKNLVLIYLSKYQESTRVLVLASIMTIIILGFTTGYYIGVR